MHHAYLSIQHTKVTSVDRSSHIHSGETVSPVITRSGSNTNSVSVTTTASAVMTYEHDDRTVVQIALATAKITVLVHQDVCIRVYTLFCGLCNL